MSKKSYRYFVGDLETTVYDGQTETEAWASGIVELFTDNVQIHTSIDETWAYLKALKSDIIIYYHNLKFDGAFWLDYFLVQKHFKQAFNFLDKRTERIPDRYMENNTVKYSISERGQWYQITVKVNNKRIIFQDSLKLLPFSVEEVGESFDTQHKKLEMEYKGLRHAGGVITEEERKYLRNDLLVIKEAIELMYEEGHKKLTIGSCCLSEYKAICKVSIKNPMSYEEMFPNIYDIKIYNFTEKNAGDYIRKSYKGGWSYLVPEKANKLFFNGCTVDVNSLYPSVMSSESGNYYPIGVPHFWKGDITEQALKEHRYYFIRIKCQFKIKDGYLPFIQIKNDLLYKGTEHLTSSDVYDKDTGIWYHNTVELTLTMTDYILMQEHYEIYDLEILSGCWFYTAIGIFDEYIDKYKQIKLTSKGARKTLAKLFLNNLYGKMATSEDSSFKIAHSDGEKLYFTTQTEKDKIPGYIPVGSAITSYARDFTIRHAQKNYHGPDKPGFAYGDTDSLHCDISPDELIDIEVHPSNFCRWKIETCWDKAIFVRPKAYIEHVTHQDLKPVDKPYHLIKCGGMPKACKNLLMYSFDGEEPAKKELNKMNEEQKEFLFDDFGNVIRRKYSDFKIGLSVPGKLRPVHMKGGVVLVDTPYVMRR